MVTIAELRMRNKKMSQRKLAKELGTTQSAISLWEKDPLSIGGKNLVKLALYFKVSTDDILGIEHNNN